jgi:diaminopimelate epimerase
MEEMGKEFPAVACIQVIHTGDTVSIIPVVRVAKTGSIVHENACGSGSIAAFLAESARRGISELLVQQPSGSTLLVKRELHGIQITGDVSYIGEGSFEY